MKKSAAEAWRTYWNHRALHIDDPYVLSFWASTSDDFDGEVFARMLEDIVTRLALSSSDSLLDVGCGNGVLLRRLAGSVATAVGLDFSIGMIQKRFLSNSTPVMAGEAGFLPFEDDVFTKVISYGVFQYFPSETYARRALYEMYRVCKPGGRILLYSIPSFDEAKMVQDRSWLKWKKYAYPLVMPIVERLGESSFFPKALILTTLRNRYYRREFFHEVLGTRVDRVEMFDEREIPGNTWNLRFDVLMVLSSSKPSHDNG